MLLFQIEKRILEIKNILADKERERKMVSGIPTELFKRRLEKENRPFLEELDKLETERRFKLDRRGGSFLEDNLEYSCSDSCVSYYGLCSVHYSINIVFLENLE